MALGGCGSGELDGEESEDEADEVAAFSTHGVTGVELQHRVLERASGIARQNQPYIFNGVQDCYGYVRQVWNAILHDGSPHREDYYPHSYNRRRWLNVAGGLPVDDAPSRRWIYFSDPRVLRPGDVLATAKGHEWGAHWHGGIYAGAKDGHRYQWDNTVDEYGSGAHHRHYWSGFHYYYRPTHRLLAE